MQIDVGKGLIIFLIPLILSLLLNLLGVWEKMVGLLSPACWERKKVSVFTMYLTL